MRCAEQTVQNFYRSGKNGTFCEVTSLDHEVLDDPVERAAFIAKALLPRAQRSEVLQNKQGAEDTVA